MALLLRTLRAACVVLFVVLAAALLALALIEFLGLCPGFSANTGLSCGGAWYERPANVALGIVLASLFTLVPAVMAIAGMIFTVIAVVRRRRA